MLKLMDEVKVGIDDQHPLATAHREARGQRQLMAVIAHQPNRDDASVLGRQSRVLLVWTRLIMPNGRSIVLERQPGADSAGYVGLQDEVDNYQGELFKAALLSTLPCVVTEVGSGVR